MENITVAIKIAAFLSVIFDQTILGLLSRIYIKLHFDDFSFHHLLVREDNSESRQNVTVRKFFITVAFSANIRYGSICRISLIK